MTVAEHDRYRHNLLASFDPQWPQIPDLEVKARPHVQRAVHRYYGMTLVAFPKNVKNPAYVVVIDENTGRFQYTREFDFRLYSNRYKDRSHLDSYAGLIAKIKSRLALPDQLTIASLVPADHDLYFAAKQMQAVRAAGLRPEDVVLTEGRYGRDARGRYCLLIERVVTRRGRTIAVPDPERGAATEL